MTAGKLIEFLKNFDENKQVYIFENDKAWGLPLEMSHIYVNEKIQFNAMIYDSKNNPIL